MTSLQETIDMLLRDGNLTQHDADEVMQFSEFLEAIKGLSAKNPEHKDQIRAIYREHYGEN